MKKQKKKISFSVIFTYIYLSIFTFYCRKNGEQIILEKNHETYNRKRNFAGGKKISKYACGYV